MKNKKTFLIGGVSILAGVTLGIALVSNSADASELQNRPLNKGKIERTMESKKTFMTERGEKMFSKDCRFVDFQALSDDQKSQLTKIMESQRTKSQEIMESFKSSSNFDKEEFAKKKEELRKTHMAEIRPFVSQDKLAEFDAFLAEGKPQMMKMMGKGWRK